jgi:threonine/homoserine/homoserine lactone efflux protein
LSGRGVERAPSQAPRSAVVIGALREPFQRGVVTSFINPKGALFFLAFLPRFLPDDRHNLAALGLGLVFSALTVVIYGGYPLTDRALRDRLARPGTFVALRTTAGIVFLGLAVSSFRHALA